MRRLLPADACLFTMILALSASCPPTDGVVDTGNDGWEETCGTDPVGETGDSWCPPYDLCEGVAGESIEAMRVIRIDRILAENVAQAILDPRLGAGRSPEESHSGTGSARPQLCLPPIPMVQRVGVMLSDYNHRFGGFLAARCRPEFRVPMRRDAA